MKKRMKIYGYYARKIFRVHSCSVTCPLCCKSIILDQAYSSLYHYVGVLTGVATTDVDLGIDEYFVAHFGLITT